MDVCVKLTVKGRVQGVGFRWYVCQQAKSFELNGYVKNLHNGDVEIEAEGDDNQVENLIKYVRETPGFSRVIDIVIEKKAFVQKYDSFDVSF
jgi:acylphosphatase